MPLSQVSSRGLRYDFRKNTLKKCANASADQQIRRPAVDVANQPAELHLRDDELHALVGFGRARPVVEQQQDAGEHLHAEQEQRHAAEVVPDLLRVDRHALFGDEVADVAQVEPFVEPVDDVCTMRSLMPRDTTISLRRPRRAG